MATSFAEQPTRASLIARLGDHADHRAWSEFEQRYGDLILGYCRRSGLQAADAEDVLQAVLWSLAKAFRGFEYDRERGRFRHYLRRTVRRAIDAHKQRHAARPEALWTEGAGAPAAASGDDGDKDWELEWMRHHYRMALKTVRETLDPNSLAIFQMLLSGAPTAAVAAACQSTEAAVRKVKQRVRDRLREQVAAQIEEEDGRD